MASFEKRGKRWRAQIQKADVRKSATFATKQEARDWAAREEALIADGARGAARIPFADVLDRYAREVSPSKKGHRWEVVRLERLKKTDMAAKTLRDLGPGDFATWRDLRLDEVAPGSVLREMNLLGSVLSVAREEWGLLSTNPMKGVRRPKEPPRRDRLVTSDELERLQLVAGSDLRHARARAVHAFLFAIETGMRAGEILSLTSTTIDLNARVAHLLDTKNGDKRDVPLSSEAVRLLKALPKADPLFDLNARDLDAAWRAVRKRAAIEGLTFHDSRHAAVTRLSRKLDVLALARMIGHRDIKMLMRYYDESAADIAKRLG